MQGPVAYLFPAFALKYTGKEVKIIEEDFGINLGQRIAESGRSLGIGIEDFDIRANNYLDKELENQVLSYVFSCTFSDILKQHREPASMVAGFSMGIYAALYHIGAIDFRSGLFLIRDFYTAVQSILQNRKYMMASVVGFSRQDLKNFIKAFGSIEVVIQNAEFSFVLNGEESEMQTLLEHLQNEGAIHIHRFNISSPYHAKILADKQEYFEKILARYKVESAEIPLISMIDQQKKSSAEDLRNELLQNVSQPLNFYKSIQTMTQAGVKVFVEVGADTNLRKSSKFIEGDLEFYSLARGAFLR